VEAGVERSDQMRLREVRDRLDVEYDRRLLK
jgi:hypothetical protein